MVTGLIVAGGGFQGLPALRALHAMGARAVIADSLEHNPNRFAADDYVCVPPVADKKAFRSALLDLCERHSVDIVLPTTQIDMPAVAELAPSLRERGVVVAASSPELLTDWADKESCLTAFRDAGLPVLPFVDTRADDVTYPLIGKPRHGFGSKDLVLAHTRDELDCATAADTAHELFWQPKLDAYDEWSIDFAINEQGTVSQLLTRQRLRSTVGFAVVSRVAESSAVRNLALTAAKLIATRGGCGMFNVQLLVEPSGELWLNDVNLRPGTSSTASLGAGINFVEFLLGDNGASKPIRDLLHVRTVTDTYWPLTLGNGIGGVALDLDDCLIDQKAWMDDKLSLLLADWHEIADVSRQESFEREARRIVDEGPWDRLLDVAAQRSELDSDLVPTLIERWRSLVPDQIVVHRDAAALVQALRAAGIPYALVTDNPTASQRQKLAKLPAELNVETAILTDELGRPKPAPDGYIAAARELGVSPARMIAVGDSPWRDAVAALDAGYAAAVIVPRRGAMGNPRRERFEHSHKDHSSHTYWLDDLYQLAGMVGATGIDQ